MVIFNGRHTLKQIKLRSIEQEAFERFFVEINLRKP